MSLAERNSTDVMMLPTGAKPHPSGNPASASAFPVANPAQAARPGRNKACVPPGHVSSFTESATEKGVLGLAFQWKDLVGAAFRFHE